MSQHEIKIGARGSLLSKAQTQIFGAALEHALGNDYKIKYVTIETLGDRKQLVEKVQRDKKDWIIDLEESIKKGEIDLAIHSSKDVPLDIDSMTTLLPVLTREIANDAVVFRDTSIKCLEDLPSGSIVGTSSLRRHMQVLQVNSSLVVRELRGNVNTRISRMENGDYDAIILATSGLIRLGIERECFRLLSTDVFLPAINQGILSAQCLKSNQEIINCLQAVVDLETEIAWTAERACLEPLGADCRSSLAIFASRISLDKFRICAKIYSVNSKQFLEDSQEFSINQTPLIKAREAGKVLANRLIECGAKEILSVA